MCLIYLMNGSLIIKQRKPPKHEFMGFLRSPHTLTGISGGSRCRGSSKDLRKKVYICRLSVTPGRRGTGLRMCQQQERLGWQWLASKYLLESRMLWQVKYGDLDKKSGMFWQQPVPLFGYNMKNWVIKDWSYTVQLCAHFWLQLELQKLQWLLRKESLAFLLICCNIPGREPMCQFKYPLKVRGTVIFPSHNAS